ncbi:MAG: SDR family NAD(P)-dependent oxidoreductase [Dehalococcoidia bacterium]|nr:SDR family NAD(P)-dependent oxidoreductase [Dehalococcoidia bacterium]MDW8007935.1 SDR family NAD(P)-dependent oxidoreductase [Chloroflexota bacterium]
MGWEGRRVVVLGAETAVGRALAQALAEAGARLALVAARADAETAFAVQRLARRLSRPGQDPILSQAIDGSNEMALRVTARQMAKALGGLDALFFCADLGPATASALELACRYYCREMGRAGGGVIVCAGLDLDLEPLAEACRANNVRVVGVTGQADAQALAQEALRLALER